MVEGKYQPMKIAAAEALWNTCPSHCAFSAFQIGGGTNDQTPTQIIEIPDLLSILATNHPDGEVQGMNNLQAQYVKEYGPGDYIPNVFIQYWGMRVMAYLAALIALFALWGLWLIRRKTLGKAKWFLLIAPWFAIAPFLMNTAGWLLTESGRQPWIVQGPDEDVPGRLALGDVDRHLDQPDRLRAPVPRAGGGRRLPDDPLRTSAVGTEPRRRAATTMAPTWGAAPRTSPKTTTGSRPSSTRRRQWSISTPSGS